MGVGVSDGSEVDVSVGRTVAVVVAGGDVKLGGTMIGRGVESAVPSDGGKQAVRLKMNNRIIVIFKRIPRLYSHPPQFMQSHNRRNTLQRQTTSEKNHHNPDIPTDDGQMQAPHGAARSY